MTIETRNYNKRVTTQKRIETFPKQAKIMIGVSILVGLMIAIALFIGTVRASEEIVRQFNP